MKNTLFIKLLVLTTLAPFTAQAQVALAPLNENQSYTMITVTPNTTGYPQVEAVSQMIKEKLKEIGDQAVKVASQGLLQPKSMNSAFAQLGKSLSAELRPFAKQINGNLPESSFVYSAYLMPYAKIEGAKTTTLPLVNNVQLIEVDLTTLEQKKNADREFYYTMNKQLHEIPKVQNEKFQFAAIAAHIKVARNNVEVKFQMLGELKSGSTEFAEANKQVIINDLEILSDEAHGNRPMAILEVLQKIPVKDKDEVEPPQIRIDLGALGNISGGFGTTWKGQFLILSDAVTGDSTCDLKFNSVPSFFGFLTQEPTEYPIANAVIGGKPVRFRIFHVIIDAETLRVKDMDIKTQIGLFSDDPSEMSTIAEKKKMFNCIENKSIGEQFTEKANASIQSKVKEFTTRQDVTDSMMNALYE